jgi:hypothetical protein
MGLTIDAHSGFKGDDCPRKFVLGKQGFLLCLDAIVKQADRDQNLMRLYRHLVSPSRSKPIFRLPY